MAEPKNLKYITDDGTKSVVLPVETVELKKSVEKDLRKIDSNSSRK